MINIWGVTRWRMDLSVASVAETGTATSTMSAPATASSADGASTSMTPNWRARSVVEGDLLYPTTRLTRPAFLSAKANEPPMRPQPIRPSCSNMVMPLKVWRKNAAVCHGVTG